MSAQIQEHEPVNIFDVAERANLKLIRMRKHGQFKTDCPFCGDVKKKLEINTDKNVFHCWVCGEGGGLIKFYALLHNVSESVAKDTLFPLRPGQRRFTHPALMLTQAQLQEIGFERGIPCRRPDSWSPREWARHRKRNLDWVWLEWKRYNAWKTGFERRIGRLLQEQEVPNAEPKHRNGDGTRGQNQRSNTHGESNGSDVAAQPNRRPQSSQNVVYAT